MEGEWRDRAWKSVLSYLYSKITAQPGLAHAVGEGDIWYIKLRTKTEIMRLPVICQMDLRRIKMRRRSCTR